jgi:hypothetical protein
MVGRASQAGRFRLEQLERRALLSVSPPTAVACLPVVDPDPFATAADVAAAPPYPTDQTFLLHSRASATKVIYLDFDGYTTSGTSWNTTYNGGQDFYTPPFSSEGDYSFSANELERIQRIWQRVSEDFSPFDVDITTQEPPLEDLRKVGAGDTRWGVRVVIGGNGSWFGSAGGVAYVGSFNYSSDTPCFVFEDMLSSSEKNIAEATSHEAGHTLGLSHDGRTSPSEEYYGGQGSGVTGWAPIMGVGYSRNLTQWSKGEYANANQKQDDLSIITSSNGFSYRTDDYGNTAGTASLLGSTKVTGVIERTTDVDAFSLPFGGGSLVLNIDPFYLGPNLDILAELRDSSNNLIASSNPLDALNASFNLTLSAGTYTLYVSGVGKGDPLTTGYSDYGSLGQYTITTANPGNDNFVNRIALNGATVTAGGTNVGSTKESGEPNHAGNVGGKSVWWTWTAPETAVYSISTAGSSFDTLLGVYTGTSVSGLTFVAGNDNASSALTSLVTFSAIAGTTYQIAVDGRDGASGTVSLAVYEPVTTPVNLSPADGVLLSSRPVTFDWEDVPAATSYSLYLNNTLFAANLTQSTWTGLATGASGNFSWRIVAENEYSSSSGPTWNFTLDTTAPTASLASTQPVTGAATLDFNVTYTDTLSGIDVSSLDDSDVYVTGPNGFNGAATFVSVNTPSNGSPRTATYRITAPGGFWSDADNGSYVVMQAAGQVKDGAGNVRPGSPIGLISISQLSFAWMDGGTLNVAFDGTATPLRLASSGSDITVTKDSTGMTFPGVSAIRARATESDDRLQLDGQLPPPLTFDDSTGNDALEVVAGTYTFASDIATASRSLGLIVGAGASAVLGSSLHLRTLDVRGTAAVPAGGNVSVIVNDLHVSGRLDLSDNELMWQTTDPTALAALTAMVAAGRNGGDWAGNGISTSMPMALPPEQLTTLGVSQAPGSVIVRYTYSGDADLNGKIDGDDYFAIDSGVAGGNAAYFRGDFDYNGRIDGDDYFAIDSHLGKALAAGPLQGAALVFSAPSQGAELKLDRGESAYSRLIEPDQM